jgi:VanZ family protein
MLIIFCFSSRPAPEAVKAVPIYEGIKLVHLAEYGILALLFIWALFKTHGQKTRNNFSLNKILLIAVLLTTAYGVIDEAHQYFVPERTAKLIDVFTDFLAALAVCGAVKGLAWNTRTQEHSTQ